MATEVILPKLGQTMEQGTIVDWLKQEGDPVKRGEVLFTIESDKAVLEVEATTSGYLRRILVPAGQAAPILTVVAFITRTADEPLPGDQPAGVPVEGVQPGLVPAAAVPSPALAAGPRGGHLFASPRARKTAREKGVSLEGLVGSGPAGRIVEQDVLAYLAARPKATPVAVKLSESLGVDLAQVPGTGARGRITKADVQAAIPGPALPPVQEGIETVPLTGLRRIIAERMAASVHTTARVTLVTEADATLFVEVREQLKAAVSEEWGFAPGYNDLLAVAVAKALRAFPFVNARLTPDGQAIERLPFVNLGMAVDTDRGLVVPVIRDADKKGIQAFGLEFRALAERARAGRSLPDDLSGGTFTITSLGTYEIDAFTPVINLPEAAILGVGRIQPKPVVVDGQVAVRQMWTLSLVFDHRLMDGAPAAQFLQWIKRRIEQPYLLLG